MPNHLAERVKRVSGEKIEGNQFSFIDSRHQDFLCWQVTGVQPEPASGNLQEGSGLFPTTKLWGGQRCSRASDRGPVIEHNPDSHHPHYLLSSTGLWSFLCFFLGGGSFSLIQRDYIEVSAQGREHGHQYLSSLNIWFYIWQLPLLERD